jgi:FixJ family two-component response regulator
LLLSERHSGTIDLLLTDVVMPTMSGPELAKRLAVTRPDMRVLCMSGYTDDSIVRHGVLESGVAFIQKPITPALLMTKVREVLDVSRATSNVARA